VNFRGEREGEVAVSGISGAYQGKVMGGVTPTGRANKRGKSCKCKNGLKKPKGKRTQNQPHQKKRGKVPPALATNLTNGEEKKEPLPLRREWKTGRIALCPSQRLIQLGVKTGVENKDRKGEGKPKMEMSANAAIGGKRKRSVCTCWVH